MKEYGVTEDWKGGLLQTAFIVCYFVSAPVFGYLGDRYSRKYLMVFGISAWTACTLTSSFMQNYNSFLVVRALIGFGEAGFTVIAPTLLADLFSDSQLTMVLALFYYSIPVGSGLGYMVGSTIANVVQDWRWGVRFTPFLTSLAVILLIFFMKDPPRGTKSQYEVNMDGMPLSLKIKSYLDDLVYLVMNKTFVLATLGFTSLCFTTGALSWWGGHLIEDSIIWRNYTGSTLPSDPPVDNVSFVFGLVMSVAGVLGLTLGSGLSYWLRPKFMWIDPVLCGGGLLISVPLLWACMYIGEWTYIPCMVVLCFAQIFLNMNWAVSVDIAMYVVVPTRRVTAQAMNLMCAHAIGEAGSPYLVGLITDSVKASYDGANSTKFPDQPMPWYEKQFLARQKGCYVTVIFELVAAVLFILAALTITKDWNKAQQEEEDLARLRPERSSGNPSECSSNVDPDKKSG